MTRSSKPKNDLSFEYVSNLLEHDPQTGRLKRKESACYQEKNGYRRVYLDGKQYMAHRVMWLLHYGAWPDGEVDHIDGDPANNKIENLRIATRIENMMNQKIKITNKSGCTGVFWRKKENKWIAFIRDNGKKIYLGLFDNLEDAIEARRKKEIEVYGEFSRLHGAGSPPQSA